MKEALDAYGRALAQVTGIRTVPLGRAWRNEERARESMIEVLFGWLLWQEGRRDAQAARSATCVSSYVQWRLGVLGCPFGHVCIDDDDGREACSRRCGSRLAKLSY